MKQKSRFPNLCPGQGLNPGPRSLMAANVTTRLWRTPNDEHPMTSILTIHFQWEDETVKERTGHPPAYADSKKIKSLALHTHGCPRVVFLLCCRLHLKF